jgi:hypothetical protein
MTPDMTAIITLAHSKGLTEFDHLDAEAYLKAREIMQVPSHPDKHEAETVIKYFTESLRTGKLKRTFCSLLLI